MSYLFDAGDSSLMGASATPAMAYRGGMQQQRSGITGRLSNGRADSKEESYMLLLELSSQEPTLQSCFKVVESTCLARGIHLKIRGRPASKEFQKFLDRYYLPFAEASIHHFFTLGFVPWRLRRLSSGDCVPEAIPLGMFTWSIDSIPNRTGRAAAPPTRQKRRQQQQHNSSPLGGEKEQVASKRAFENQKEYFASKKHPYPLHTDTGKKVAAKVKSEQHTEPHREEEEEDGAEPAMKKRASANNTSNTPAYYRQQDALRRQNFQQLPTDDEDTKMLRYTLHLLFFESLAHCSCGWVPCGNVAMYACEHFCSTIPHAQVQHHLHRKLWCFGGRRGNLRVHAAYQQHHALLRAVRKHPVPAGSHTRGLQEHAACADKAGLCRCIQYPGMCVCVHTPHIHHAVE